MSDKTKPFEVLQLEAFEIESLNIDNLDVEELEQRIEMAAGMPIDMGVWCDCNGQCSNCAFCSTLCTCEGTNVCDTYCGTFCESYCGALCDTDCIDVIIPV